jgi:hypothetical protein
MVVGVSVTIGFAASNRQSFVPLATVWHNNSLSAVTVLTSSPPYSRTTREHLLLLTRKRAGREGENENNKKDSAFLAYRGGREVAIPGLSSPSFKTTSLLGLLITLRTFWRGVVAGLLVAAASALIGGGRLRSLRAAERSIGFK